ncbi:PVC-type heme-binding CxxCH protein [Catalinimonas sp. 4WD22]|uniref:PVC-type heme-binding CxxCH protein n=1 Tax=Catalinimonas locisalis TaxID=3133978 RepID=UPI003100D125
MCIQHYLKPSLRLLYIFLILHTITTACKAPSNSASSPTDAEEALSTFELVPGFKIELVAAEPLVSDPVDMMIDEFGRMYVLEMHGYPLDKSGTGKVKLLSDTDGDGKMDKSTVFADGLVLPFGISRWEKGVIVTDAPDILYLEDTTGDGVADIRETMLTGFALSNAQMDVSNPIYGLDNWIYLTSESGGTYQVYKEEFGDLGSDIYYPAKPEGPHLPLVSGGRTVRFRPDQFQLETTSGQTQFGHDFDAWGRHMLGNNSNHIYHEVMAAPYLNRNPDLPVSNASQSISDHGDAAEVFPITHNPDHQLLTNVGVITAACGNVNYLGGAFPDPYDDNTTFVAEPVSNLVHVDHLKDNGASFTASRMHPEKEFLASTDAWFRPVNMYVGPDGALYVVDFYRQIIEHPEWMSEEAIKAANLYNGEDLGRIYRVVPTDAGPADWTRGLELGNALPEQLVAQLSNPNKWWRINAQRLLVDQANPQAIPALEKMAQHPTSSMGRLHALWTLEGMNALSRELIMQALKDTVAGIRENAIKLAELHLDDFPELQGNLLAMQKDPNPKVRFQLLCTLGEFDSPQAGQVRKNLLFQDIDDQWVQIAALSASSSQAAPLLTEVLNDYDKESAAYGSLVQRLTTIVGASGDPSTIHQLIQKATSTETGNEQGWQSFVLYGLAQGISNRESTSSIAEQEQNELVDVFFNHPSQQIRMASLQLISSIGISSESLMNEAMENVATLVADKSLSDEKRVEAINFLKLRNPAEYSDLLKNVVVLQEQPMVQIAALDALSLIPDKTVSQLVLERWSTLTPEVRTAAVNTFLSDSKRVPLLLDALDQEKISTSSLTFRQKVRLMTQSDENLRARARSMFAANGQSKVTQKYQKSLTLEGDGVEGKKVYLKNCALCHQFKGELGVKYGPDLGTVHSWQPEAIMSHILDPNISIAVGYDLWKVDLNRGESVQGIISSETQSAITLHTAPGVEKVINRQNIQNIKTLNMSAMPTGLEKQISQQEMADLLVFLRKND